METNPHTQTQLRFPRDGWDADSMPKAQIPWAIASHGLTQPAWKILGGETHVVDTIRKVAALIDARPEDFAAASVALRPEGWRLLYVCGNAFALESLVLPRFEAQLALRDLCDLQKHHGGPPVHLIGSSAEGIAHETEVALRSLSPGESAAAWTILSAAHAFNFEDAELLGYEWWTPFWLRLVADHICADNAQ